MVAPSRPPVALLCWLLLALGPASRLAAADIPDYKLGETATTDVVTPIPLVVIDPEQTEVLKQKEASRVPVMCRYYTNALPQAEAEFRSALNAARDNFLDQVETAFKRRTLDAPTLASQRFQRLAASFPRQYKAFPVTTNLLALWTQGESDDAFESLSVAALRAAMSRPLRPPNIPADVKFGATIRLVPLADWEQVPTLELAEKSGLNCSRSNIVTWTRARDGLLAGFPPEERPLAKFLAGLLKTNCLPDMPLTGQARALRTAQLWAADHYEAGQVLVRQGQAVDKRIRAALAQLSERTALANAAQQSREAASRAEVTTARTRWAAGGLAALLLVLTLVLWRTLRRRRPASLLPARIAGNGASATIVACPTCAETIVVPGAPADSTAELRVRLAPYLARLLMDKFVRKVLAQRTGLIDTQERAAAEMAELESRLEKIHAPLQDRLRAYEERIGELEKELARKGEENRELIKLKIALVRSQLTAAKERLELN